MRNHFDKNLNVRSLILEYKPERFLELGALCGDNTKQIVKLKDEAGFPKDIVIISDNVPRDEFKDTANWIQGVSYIEMRNMGANSFQFVSVDTDHNGYTLDKEMQELCRIVPIGGIVVLHDTTTHWDNNGYAPQYYDGTPYPEDIKQCHLTMGAVLTYYLSSGWEKIRQVHEYQGAMAIRRMS